MLFRLEDVYKSYSTAKVLRGVTFQVNPNEKVGLIGRNGAGKSTIFKLVCNVETPDTGSVIRMNNLSIGLLDQHPKLPQNTTVIECAQSVFTALHKIEQSMQVLEHEMSEHSTESIKLDEILTQYSKLQHNYEEQGGFTYKARTEEVLMGLSITKDIFNSSVEVLSGGQRGRLHLAMLLLSKPDILLLDEPTNHLDLNAVEWLENFLTTYKSAYIIISHDRFLLDKVTTRTIEIDNGVAISYSGSFSEYIVKRDAEREVRQRHYEKQQEEIARTEEFIRRNLAGQKTKQAKSRRTQLAKLERIEAVQISNSSPSRFKLAPVSRSGDNVLVLEELSIGYDNQVIAGPLNLTVHRQDKLGIIGPNGSGKTSLLKTLLRKIEPINGRIQWGTGVKSAYYDQHLGSLNLNNTVLAELQAENTQINELSLRSFLAKFLFRDDDVFKNIGTLSGGERSRLALAKLIYSQSNVLIFDEPTNHLDINSCEALEQSLREYDGTCLIVSHDRYFLNQICNRILYLEPNKNCLFEGTYNEFVETRQTEQTNSLNLEKETKTQQPIKQKPKSDKTQNKKKKLRTSEDIEKDIHTAESELQLISENMAKPEIASDPDQIVEYQSKYDEIMASLELLYSEWEIVMHENSVE